jgi:hypothetical protein
MNENKNLLKLGYRFNFKKYFTVNIAKLKFTDYDTERKAPLL